MWGWESKSPTSPMELGSMQKHLKGNTGFRRGSVMLGKVLEIWSLNLGVLAMKLSEPNLICKVCKDC